MALIRDLIGNQFRDEPVSTGDVMSNYFGGGGADSDPQANVRPKSTTINYNDDGGVEITHKQTIDNSGAQEQAAPPQELVNLRNSSQLMNGQPNPAMAPARAPWLAPSPQQVEQAVPGSQPFVNTMQAMETPTPMPQARPVAPQVAMQPPPDTFNRMVQAESVGQQNGPNGQILTSPKGAVGIAQIMPSTARQPGYNITPATPAELATPEGNLAFGQRYFDGMFKKFGSDPEKAAAAYNSGPGTIEKAVQTAAAQGGDWKDYIPAETKNYLTKVFPQQKEEQANRFKPMLASIEGTRIDANMTPTEQVVHHLALNSRDVSVLGQGAYAGDHLLDPVTKKAYADQHAEVMKQNQLEKKAEVTAQKLIESGGAGMQRALKDQSEEGSYLRAYMFQRLGLTDLAKNEQQKLGAGDMWAQTMINGKPAWVKFNGQGAPIKGYNAAGALSADELLASSGNLTKAQVGTQIYADPLSETGARYAIRRINGRAEWINTSTQAVETDPEIINRLTPLGVAGTIAVAGERRYTERGQGQRGKQGAETGTEQLPLPLSNSLQTTRPAPVEPTTVSEAPVPAAQTPMSGAVAPQASAPAVRAPAPAVRAPAPALRPVAPVTTGAIPTGSNQQPGESYSQYQQRKVLETKAVEAQIGVGAEEQRAFNKDKTDFASNASNGQEIASIRKRNIDNILSDPAMVGYLTDPTTSGRFNKLIREISTGAYKDDTNGKRLADDIRTLGIPATLIGKIEEFKQANTRINALTLKTNEGPGAISNTEQIMNQNSNMTNIGDLTVWSTLTGLGQQKITGDIAVVKQRFAEQHPELGTATKFEAAWSKERAGILAGYNGVYQARLNVLKPYYDSANKSTNRNNDTVQQAYRDATVAAFRTYPTPDYNAQTGKWEYRTKEAKMAAMRGITGGK